MSPHQDHFAQGFPVTLQAARGGTAWAWEALYRELAPRLVGYLRAQGAAEPEDLTGEVFVQLVRNLPRFVGDESGFRSWVFLIAHHRLLEERRHRSRRPADPSGLEPGAEAPGGDVEDEVLVRPGTERVRRLIGRLSPGQRDVLLLRILGGLTVPEVAAVIGRGPGAVKALQRRGLAALARGLSHEGVPLPGPPAVTEVR